MAAEGTYPARLSVEYQEEHDRVSVLFRLFLFIPAAIMVALLSGGGFEWTNSEFADETRQAGQFGGGLFLAIIVIVFVRQYIPRWIFDFQVNVFQFSYRVYGYLALLTDQYPAFESQYPINVAVDYPERLNRWKVLIWKVITSIPHFIILFFLAVISIVLVLVAWFVILFTGKYPRGIFDFVVGVMRWSLRVGVYVFSMTDEYPPFSLE